MDILGNDAPPYYTVYFYDWAGDHTLCSFYDVDIIHRGKGFWQATFQVVRSDGKIFDTFSIDRKDPLRKKQSTPPINEPLSVNPRARIFRKKSTSP